LFHKEGFAVRSIFDEKEGPLNEVVPGRLGERSLNRRQFGKVSLPFRPSFHINVIQCEEDFLIGLAVFSFCSLEGTI
jgi:hypothetical protein